MRSVAFLLVFIIPSFAAPSCATYQSTFASFLRKYNPWGDGPKATISVLTAELGKPTTLQPSPGSMTKAVYVYEGCVGEVMLDSKGFALTTRVEPTASRPPQTDTRAIRISGIEKQIRELEQQIGALKEMRAALQSAPDVQIPFSEPQASVSVALTNSPESSPALSKDRYDRVSSGMNYREVASILGQSGEEVSSSDFAGNSAKMYSWKNEDGSNISILFQNGKLVTKAQYGLK
jgi:hypothetical protein